MKKADETKIFREQMGERLRNIRKLKRLSQDDLAKGINMTRASLVNIEAGKQALTAINMWGISNLLKISPSDLFPASENSITLSIQAEIHELKNEAQEWKSKYHSIVNNLQKIKEHL